MAPSARLLILPCGSVVPMATWWSVRLRPGHESICLAPIDKHLRHLYFSPLTDAAVENAFVRVSLLTCQGISETL